MNGRTERKTHRCSSGFTRLILMDTLNFSALIPNNNNFSKMFSRWRKGQEEEKAIGKQAEIDVRAGKIQYGAAVSKGFLAYFFPLENNKGISVGGKVEDGMVKFAHLAKRARR